MLAWIAARSGTLTRSTAAVAAFLAVLGASGDVLACDICAIYTATEMQATRPGPRLGLAQQYTHFGTLQDDDNEVPNPANEYLDSAITQFIAAYQVHPRVRVQVNLPLIFRSFRRLTDDGVKKGDENGIGDLSLTANVLVWSYVSEQSVVRFSVTAGLKFPTGNADRLKEEIPPDPRDLLNEQFFAASSDRGGGAHGEVESGVHGHDLALGTGSFDGVFGGQLFATWERGYWATRIQYIVRTRGDFEYEYADELTVDAGPGVFVVVDHDYTLGLAAGLAMETKGKDNIDGTVLDDTGITALYAGPALHFTWGTSLSLELAGELPAIQNNTALQIVPDYRIRGGLVWRF